MKLNPTSYPGVTRYMHFKEANAALEAAMETNPALAELGITVPKSPAGSILGKSPENWVWHHDLEPGVMQLVPKSQHPNIPGGIFWETMHPGGDGGFSIWESNEAMKLIDLVTYFRHGGTFEDFCKKHALDAESEVIEIYAQAPASLESQLGFFPIEETEGRAEFLSDGVKYQTLFDFFYFLEVIEDVKGQEALGDAELAQKLMSYALKDA